jgi:hypothetical protein
MIFLVIIQATLLFNANMVVNYATFSAARVATVVVPMEINDEGHNLVHPPEIQPSDKLELIRRAAVLALVPVSASLNAGAPDRGGQSVHDQTAAVFSHFGQKDQPWFRFVQAQYDYANTYTQIELAKPGHWQDGNPDNDCPYSNQRRDAWTPSGWSYVPYCPYFHRDPMIWDFWYWEDLNVRVTYGFLLEVPYASRFLGEQVQIPGRTGNQYAARIRVVVTLTNEGGPEIRPKDQP